MTRRVRQDITRLERQDITRLLRQDITVDSKTVHRIEARIVGQE